MKSLSVSELKAIRRELERKHYLASFWDFARELLGYRDIAPQPHKEVFDFLLKPGERKLVLLPRNSFKSTILGVAYPLWRLAQDPNLRILLDSRTVDRAKLNLAAIKEHIERNARFREVFGDWKHIPGWRETSLTLPHRTAKHREPSIMCGGIDAPVTGGHYELIIVDDLHDETNSNTQSQLAKAVLHYKTLDPILSPGGQIIVIGTRWHREDTYAHILEEHKVTGRWQILQRAAYNPDGTLWFPQLLTREFLEEKRARLGPYLFSAQYLLQAIAQEDQRFLPAWIQYRDIQLIAAEGKVQLSVDGGPGFPVSITTTVDPAISQTKGSDYTGIVTVATDSAGRWYVLSARRIKGSAEEVINEIVREVRTYFTGIVGIEAVAYQKALKEFLDRRFYEEGLLVATRELISGSGRSKRTRIEGLVPKFSQGEVFLRIGIGPELEQELLSWTPAQELRHDDLIDALSHQLTLALPPSPRGGATVVGASWWDLPPEERARWRRQHEPQLGSLRPRTGYGD